MKIWRYLCLWTDIHPIYPAAMNHNLDFPEDQDWDLIDKTECDGDGRRDEHGAPPNREAS